MFVYTHIHAHTRTHWFLQFIWFTGLELCGLLSFVLIVSIGSIKRIGGLKCTIKTFNGVKVFKCEFIVKKNVILRTNVLIFTTQLIFIFLNNLVITFGALKIKLVE